jgi:hypothetical protein
MDVMSAYFSSGTGGVETRDNSNGGLISEVMIAHAGPEHAGEYRCLARNLYGSDELLFRLFVKGTKIDTQHSVLNLVIQLREFEILLCNSFRGLEFIFNKRPLIFIVILYVSIQWLSIDTNFNVR